MNGQIWIPKTQTRFCNPYKNMLVPAPAFPPGHFFIFHPLYPQLSLRAQFFTFTQGVGCEKRRRRNPVNNKAQHFVLTYKNLDHYVSRVRLCANAQIGLARS